MAGHYNIAVMLLNSDCNLELRNGEGFTALQLAYKLEQRTGNARLSLVNGSNALLSVVSV